MKSPAEKLAAKLAKKPKSGGPLNKLRESLNLTLREVSDGAGVSAATVCRCEDGKTPDLATARALARFFGVSIDDLFPEPKP